MNRKVFTKLYDAPLLIAKSTKCLLHSVSLQHVSGPSPPFQSHPSHKSKMEVGNCSKREREGLLACQSDTMLNLVLCTSSSYATANLTVKIQT